MRHVQVGLDRPLLVVKQPEVSFLILHKCRCTANAQPSLATWKF